MCELKHNFQNIQSATLWLSNNLKVHLHLRFEVVALDPRGFLHLVALQHPTLSPLFLSTFPFCEKEEKEKSGLRQVIMMRTNDVTNDVGRISGEDSTFHSLFQIMLVWHQVTFSPVTRALIAGIAPTLSIGLCGFLEIWTYGTQVHPGKVNGHFPGNARWKV